LRRREQKAWISTLRVKMTAGAHRTTRHPRSTHLLIAYARIARMSGGNPGGALAPPGFDHSVRTNGLAPRLGPDFCKQSDRDAASVLRQTWPTGWAGR